MEESLFINVRTCKMSKHIRDSNMKNRKLSDEMFATGGLGYPVASFERCLSKLNPNHTSFLFTSTI